MQIRAMSCSTPSFLHDVKKRLLRSTTSKSEADMASHVDAALNSYVAPLQLFRTLEDFTPDRTVRYPDITKIRHLDVLSAGNCHNGQKKLTMSVLEFVAAAISRLKCPQSDLFVVYAGASGLASVVAATVFTDVQFMLFDPAPNTVKLLPPFPDKVVYTRVDDGHVPDLSKQLVIYTDRAGWFTDDTARRVKLLATRKHLLFISDIRVEATESAIIDDMRNQERWALLTESSMYMFKFRIPYGWDDGVKARYNDFSHMSFDATGVHLKPPEHNSQLRTHNSAPSFTYLAGDLYIQLYPRQRTGELRLIGARNTDGTYDLKQFFTRDIEDKMALFNYIYRSHVHFKYGRSKYFLTENDMPMYEPVAEYAIICKCCLALGSRTKEMQLKMHHDVNALIAKFISKDGAACALKAVAKEIPRLDAYTMRYLLDCVDRIDTTYPGELDQDLVHNLRSKFTAMLAARSGQAAKEV